MDSHQCRRKVALHTQSATLQKVLFSSAQRSLQEGEIRMGIIFSRPPEALTGGAPFFRSPFSEVTSPIGHHDEGKCLDHQLRFIDCLEAYGHVRGKEKCKLLYQDFVECAQSWKQLHRVEVIKEVRDQKWFLGMTGNGPKFPMNSEHTPNPDYFSPNFHYDEP